MLTNQKRTGQTTIIFILIVIVIFAGMAVFLLSLAETVSQSEYITLYTYNLLSSLLKTDTGQTAFSCKTVSDVLACSFLTPTYVCGNQDCFNFADETINARMDQFAVVKEGFRYLLTVEPEGFVSLPYGSPYTIEIGDSSLKEEKIEKITARERIQKVLDGKPYLLTVTLTLAKKETA
ncbi:MAG: hypothetical protein ISS93_03400 [Candidatus Aenigmarchaeota archaeon]|nr:hypothetical protein [Candidatus Aenigmarchaeota archaeon]